MGLLTLTLLSLLDVTGATRARTTQLVRVSREKNTRVISYLSFRAYIHISTAFIHHLESRHLLVLLDKNIMDCRFLCGLQRHNKKVTMADMAICEVN